MDLEKIGKYLSKKRKAKRISQEKLALKLDVYTEDVIAWEEGKAFPNNEILEELCEYLKISIIDLMNGEDNSKDANKAVIRLLENEKKYENQKHIFFGVFLILLGVCSFLLANNFKGTDFKDFIAGVLLGLSLGQMIVGIYVITKSMVK